MTKLQASVLLVGLRPSASRIGGSIKSIAFDRVQIHGAIGMHRGKRCSDESLGFLDDHCPYSIDSMLQ